MGYHPRVSRRIRAPRLALACGVLVLGLASCDRHEPAGASAASTPSASVAPTPSAAVSLAASATPDARGCSVTPAGGSVVARSEHAPYDATIAANSSSVAITWLEQGASVPCRGGSTCVPVDGRARELDPSLQAIDASPGPSPLRLTEGSEVESHSGLSAVALPGGGAFGASCRAHVVSSRVECDFRPLGGAPLADSSWAFESHNSAIVVGRGAATAVGSVGLAVAPVRGELYLFATGTKARRELVAGVGATGLEGNFVGPGVAWVDAPALAAAGVDQAVVVWRASPPGGPSGSRFLPPARPGARGSVRARLVGADGHARGGVVVVSAAGDDVGVPSVTWIDGTAVVAYAHRKAGTEAGTEPWTIALARWPSGASEPTRSDVDVAPGGATVTAPAVVRTPGAGGCVVVSWTEGAGHATSAHAARACGPSWAPSGGVALSAAGVEAGPSELASDGSAVYVVWQEVPGHGAPVELRAARVQCTD
jgi:hypothetical protein